MDKKVDIIVKIQIDKQTILDRLNYRRICSNCGAIYNLKNVPPQKEGICDICSGKLIQRSDDKREKILERIKIYEEITKPVLQYYKEHNIDIYEYKVEKDSDQSEKIKKLVYYIKEKAND